MNRAERSRVRRHVRMAEASRAQPVDRGVPRSAGAFLDRGNGANMNAIRGKVVLRRVSAHFAISAARS
jgi:hypothetical protein